MSGHEEIEPPDNVVRLEDRRGRLNIVEGSNLHTVQVQSVVFLGYTHQHAADTLYAYLRAGVRIVCPDVILRVVPRPTPPPAPPPPEPEPFSPVLLQGEGQSTVLDRMKRWFRPKPKGVT